MTAAVRTPTLCTRSPSTWMKAALTLALAWLWWWAPCRLSPRWDRPGVKLWVWPCGAPDWWRIRAILQRRVQTGHWQPAPENRSRPWAHSSYSQDVDGHSTAGGDEHDVTVDVVVSGGDPLHGRHNQRCCHSPHGHDRQQHAHNLCKTQQFVTSNTHEHHVAGQTPIIITRWSQRGLSRLKRFRSVLNRKKSTQTQNYYCAASFQSANTSFPNVIDLSHISWKELVDPEFRKGEAQPSVCYIEKQIQVCAHLLSSRSRYLQASLKGPDWLLDTQTRWKESRSELIRKDTQDFHLEMPPIQLHWFHRAFIRYKGRGWINERELTNSDYMP